MLSDDTAGHGDGRGLCHDTQRSSGHELKRSGEALALIRPVAHEFQKGGVAAGVDDGKCGSNGATESGQDSGITRCTITHRDDVMFYSAPVSSQ